MQEPTDPLADFAVPPLPPSYAARGGSRNGSRGGSGPHTPSGGSGISTEASALHARLVDMLRAAATTTFLRPETLEEARQTMHDDLNTHYWPKDESKYAHAPGRPSRTYTLEEMPETIELQDIEDAKYEQRVIKELEKTSGLNEQQIACLWTTLTIMSGVALIVLIGTVVLLLLR